MSSRIPCEFFLIRYVPDVVKGEFVNIGVLLREAVSTSLTKPCPMRARFTRDWSRVRCLDAGADLGLLEDLEREFTRLLAVGASVEIPKSPVEVLEESLSNSIQFTGPHATLAENLAAEMDQLMRLYVERLEAPRARTSLKATGRPAIHASMRSEFERAGVWQAMNKRIAADRYTRRGDPLRIDCGYRCVSEGGEIIRMFHAVSLEGDIEMARVLAFAAPQLREGVARIEHAALELTAAVEPLQLLSPVEDSDEAGLDNEAMERYRFGVETLEQREIRVVTIADLARVAATARRELGF